MKLKSLVSGVVIGSILGGLSALLLTPANGREVRGCIIQKYKEAKHSLQSVSNDAKLLTNQARLTLETGTTAAKAISKEVKQSVNDWREDIEPHLRQLQEDIDKLQQLAQARK
ncbi:MAG TPA: hypothetical protein GX525_08975 [Bacilli bacterium]|nr:hypothetical protein [Bacilli bacterium]